MPTSKLPSSSASSSRGKSTPITIDFPDGFASGDLYKWCQGLSGTSRLVASLQIRRDVGNAVPHRFVMVRMLDNSIHRFDRRPEQRTSDNIPGHTMLDLLLNRAVKREDSYVHNLPLDLLEEISLLTYCEIELFFEEQQLDLLTIVSACFGISRNSVADKYTFLKHNCFFFSWTILMVVARHCLPYAIPPEESLKMLSKPMAENLVNFVADRAMGMILEFVLQVILIIREKLNDHIVLTKSRVSDRVLRFLWRRFIALRSTLGLRRRIFEHVQRQINERLIPIYRSIIDMGFEQEHLDRHLWIEELSATIGPYAREAINKIKWEALIEAGSSIFLNSEDSSDLALKKSILGKGFAQFMLAWKTALPAGMNAVRDAVAELDGSDSDAVVFDKCWSATRNATLTSLRSVIEVTGPQVNNQRLTRLWNRIFEVWDECWEDTCALVKPKCLLISEDLVDEAVKTGTGIAIQGIRNQIEDTLQACLTQAGSSQLYLKLNCLIFQQERNDPKVKTTITSAALQEYMQKCIKSYAFKHATLDEINSSMADIWREARNALQLARPEAEPGESTDA